MTDKEQEYQEFIMKASDKAREIREEFDNLSRENQARFLREVDFAAGITALMNLGNLG